MVRYAAYAMKTDFLIPFSSVAALLLLASNWPSSQVANTQNVGNHESSSRALRLSLSIRADQRAYRMSDPVRLETQLTNTGGDTIYLFSDVCWNPGNFLTIHVFDARGKEVSGHSDFLRDCLPPPPAPNDTTRFFKLEPGTFYGVVEKFDTRELVPGPGEYTMVAHYVSGISKEWISKYGGDQVAALPIWTREQPQLRSNRLRLAVKP